MTSRATHIHHVGLSVRDMAAGLELFRRLGFVVPPPEYVMLKSQGGEMEPLGPANTHAYFERNFIELLTCAADARDIPPDAVRTPLDLPPEHLEHMKATIEVTIAEIAGNLARFEGVHRTVFAVDDIDEVARTCSDLGIEHSVIDTKRPLQTADGMQLEPIRVIEIAGHGGVSTPEGNIALAEVSPFHGERVHEHPNGAVDLVEAILCVADADLAEVEGRYTRYLGCTATDHHGFLRVFELSGSRFTLVPASKLDDLLPGETPPAVPAFVAYGVTVRDLDTCRTYLRDAGFELAKSMSGHAFVPAGEANGCAIVLFEAK